ncbi:MAG: TolC family protein, partial [Leptolyngbyaceae bacterium]|nr:TolC family protein [Leptolyngbyaceae bacterium]
MPKTEEWLNKMQGWGWNMRVLSLTVGGSVSVMAIAFLGVITPRSLSVDAIAPPPLSDNPTVRPDLLSRPHPNSPSTPYHPHGSTSTSLAPVEVVAPLGTSRPMPQPFLVPQQVGTWSTVSTHESPVSAASLRANRTRTEGQGTDSSVPDPDVPADAPPRTPSLTQAPHVPLPLVLQDVVVLALENNRTIKNAYLDRIIEQADLAIAEDRFNPNLTSRIELGTGRNDQGLSTVTGVEAELGAEMDVRLPTGTEFSVSWQTDGWVEDRIGLNPGGNHRVGQTVAITVIHPLWRNAGQAINRAPIHLAHLQDDQARFRLKSTLITTITTAIQGYYRLVLAQQQLKIQQAGLGRAEADLTRMDALIAAGREPAIQRVEAEASVANRRVDVLAATDALRSAQLELIQALDVDPTFAPEATEMAGLVASEIQFADDDTLVKYAVANNPDYQADLLDLDIAAIQLLQSENDRRWDLNLVLTYLNALDSQAAERSDVQAGIRLGRELGDRSLKQRVIQQRTRIQQLENTHIENLENLEINIRNALREVAFQQAQVEQAQRATQLAQQQLENTQEQLRGGRKTFSEVIQAQDDLVDAQDRELQAQIDYQNALINLDQQLG